MIILQFFKNSWPAIKFKHEKKANEKNVNVL